MAKGGFLDSLKDIIADMVDANGNIRVIPVGLVGRRNLSKDKIKLLSDLILLLKDSTIISNETKAYINNKYITIRGVNELFNSRLNASDTPIKGDNTLAKIQYDKRKLEGIFGKDFFTNVLAGKCDVDKYDRLIKEQFVRYSKNFKLRDGLVIKIPIDCVSDKLSDEKFNEFIEIIVPYLKSQMKFVEDNLDKESCGYFNYLLGAPKLTGVDKERAQRLIDMLIDK